MTEQIELSSFSRPITAIVVGVTGGIGSAFMRALASCPEVTHVHALARNAEKIATPDGAAITRWAIDFDDEQTLADAAKGIGAADLILVATGALHDTDHAPEKSMRSLNADGLHWAFQANTVPPTLVAKHFLPLLPRTGKSVFAALSARVGSISDNRLGGWYGYRASKAALNQIIRCLAIELARKSPDALVIGLHPGTVDTSLSQPFQSGVPDGGLFTPDRSAAALLSVIDGLSSDATGRCFDWKGEEIAS